MGITQLLMVITRTDTLSHVSELSVGSGMLPGEMSRHTTFKFCLDPTVEQCEVLARHAGAARFAFNQCLRIVKTALTQRKVNPGTEVPWTGFDLINVFNAWKKTESAGRVFTVDTTGVAETVVTGLPWRTEVCQQVFEEAAVDLSKGLGAWSDSRCGRRKGKRVGFPRFKKKIGAVPAFRLRNKHPKDRRPTIRVGDNNRPRAVTLPGVGQIRVHDDTRRLRRLLAKGRAKICYATVTQHAGRWWVSLNVEADDLHPAHRHQSRDPGDDSGWVGIDRGLSAFLVAVTGDGEEVARITDAPKALVVGMKHQRQLAKSLSRKKKDHAIAAMLPPGWPGITITSLMLAAISYTGCLPRWSRPTTGSSSRTLTCRECWPTTA
jgi:putative transposase